MQRLFITIALLSGAIFFQSCTPARQYYQPLTQRPHQPWEGNSTKWGGYTESSIGKNQVKVTFETFNRPGSDFANYFVKVRAAEIALAQGNNTFWLRNLGTKRWTQKSHFPGRLIPGYWEYRDHEIYRCSKHCKKGCRKHVDIIREQYWVPERYIPPHTSVNHLGKAEVIMSGKPSGTQMQATQIIGDALSGRHGFGKPRLSPQTMNAYKAHLTQANR